MSNWYQKGNNNGSWGSGWNKGGWRPKGQGKGTSQTPITDLVTSLQSSMKEQQLLQALAPALLSGTVPAPATAPAAPAAPTQSQAGIPDELKSVLCGLKESIDSIAKVHTVAAQPLAWTPTPPTPAPPACRQPSHQDAEVQLLKQELGDFRESLRQLQQTHPIGQLQHTGPSSSAYTPPPRKRVLDGQDSADKAPTTLPKVTLPSKATPGPRKDEPPIICKDAHKRILNEVFEITGVRCYGDLPIDQWCSKHISRIPEEDLFAVSEAWGLEATDAEDALLQITKLWLIQQGPAH